MRQALIVLSGGLNDDGSLNESTRARADKALELWQQGIFDYLITTSRGTVYKPPKLSDGFPLDEARAIADYLSSDVDAAKILTETTSFDTIGNAVFCRLIFIDPLEITGVTVVTSDFHMPRSKLIFNWVTSLQPDRQIKLKFVSVADSGSSELLAARAAKEREGITRLMPLTEKLETVADTVSWLYSKHNAYKVNQGEHYQIDELTRSTY